MTFPDKLTELLDAIKNEVNPFKRFSYVQQMDALLVNHAEAIRDLVVAAEEIHAERDEQGRTLCCETRGGHHAKCELNNALAKLEQP